MSASLEAALADDLGYREAMRQEDWPALAKAILRVVGTSAPGSEKQTTELHWGGYLAVDTETRQIVGSCAFKDAPSGDGVVEIAYFTYPDFEGRGYATAMARHLLQLAAGAPEVRRVIAHTLPESTASARILKRIGMTFVGEVVDPHDGLIWRWERATRSTELA
jgi:RimJ/RimL family protein N-acetyltransferase